MGEVEHDEVEHGETEQDTLVITFRKPVEHAGSTYEDITLRAPSWGEMKGALKQGALEASTWLAAMMGKVPMQALNKLDARDGAAIDKFFARFS